MSSESLAYTTQTARTVVPSGISDPVERARAELSAALAAIEHKANLPARAAEKVEDGVAGVRRLTRRNPAAGIAVVTGVAAALGAVVWGVARLVAR